METAPTTPTPNPVPGAGRLLTKRPPPGRQTTPGATPSAAGPHPAVVSLSWEHEDIENRWGVFKGGRFTSVNKIFTFIIAAAISTIFLWLMEELYRGTSSLHHIGEMFVRPGNLYATGPATLFFFWGVVISLVKIPKLRLQRRALELAAVPQHREFVLNETTAKTVLDRVRSLVDDTRYFILLNRIDRALSNLHNIGGVSDVSTILKAQSENDENQVASSYAVIHAMIWAIPVLGFVGTVLGLSIAIQKFTGALTGTTDVNQIKDHLKEVTAGLSTAFETTLVGLAFALLLHLLSDLVQQKETDFLDECNDYCHAHVVSKLRVRPKEGNPE
ncbi:MAG TPA: MotA/TolQ/ExbB proton channel family protein [Verrucomicrobiae bacterium]|jgi:biopolymer transport protein ExbB/TolQ|nr:MotA/TolQ/ExbB proton channel family protein [Verrucomicrobiae bacterium]